VLAQESVASEKIIVLPGIPQMSVDLVVLGFARLD
jgi:hypothetical protein